MPRLQPCRAAVCMLRPHRAVGAASTRCRAGVWCDNSGIIGDVLTPLFATLVGHGVAWNRRAVHVVASAAVVLLPLCLAKVHAQEKRSEEKDIGHDYGGRRS